MEVTTIVVGQMQANCYLVVNEKTNECVIVDPGDDAELIIETYGRIQAMNRITNSEMSRCADLKDKNENYYRDKSNNGKPELTGILLTHGHFDHCMAALEVQLAFDVPVYVHEKDQFLLDRMAETAKHFLGNVEVPPAPKVNYELPMTNYELEVIETPGHTPGSVSFYFPKEKKIFVGDVIFENGGYGRTDFSYCSHDDLMESIKRLMKLPEDVVVYPGHYGETTIGEERNFWS